MRRAWVNSGRKSLVKFDICSSVFIHLFMLCSIRASLVEHINNSVVRSRHMILYPVGTVYPGTYIIWSNRACVVSLRKYTCIEPVEVLGGSCYGDGICYHGYSAFGIKLWKVYSVVFYWYFGRCLVKLYFITQCTNLYFEGIWYLYMFESINFPWKLFFS